MQKKKPWSKPEVNGLPLTGELLARIAEANRGHAKSDELLDLIARNCDEQAPMPVKRTK
jgi:hypothetical protein